VSVSRPAVLILGGARSGKSRYALERARALQGPVAVVATAEPGDAEMARRIERHRAERPPNWLTLEEPLDLGSALRGLARRARVVIVDCLTLWVANLMEREPDDAPILGAADDLAKLIAGRPYHLLIVSNEVGLGVHPETPGGLRFRDLLGLVNHKIAAEADQVVWLAAGLPLMLKDRTAHGHSPEAP
jgi:adenosyl cobinamide kinase/adenosyl cobinamide phosphate guanylyltransferase